MIIWISIAILICILVCARSHYECRTLSVERYEIKSDKVKTSKKLVFLSDLHDNQFGEENRELVEAIKSEKPELILIGGDMMNAQKNRPVDLKNTKSLIMQLKQIAPLIYGNGNHEMRMQWYPDEMKGFREEFEAVKSEVIYLSDSSAELDDLQIYGLDIDEKFYDLGFHPYITSEYITDHLGEIRDGKFNILLSHNPLYFNAYTEWGTDLTLAGHFHGGMIRLPGGRGICSSQLEPFCKYCSGEFEKDNKRMIVSRGLGTHTINLRINNKPQLVVVELYPN